MAREQIIIDTDPGQDDALALLLALGSPEELDVIGVTAVAGNAPLAWTEVNARKICELAGRPDVAVYAGADRPLSRELHTAPEVHGSTGLNGPILPAPTMPLQAEHAVDFIVRTLNAAPSGTISLVTLGPLTNVALALQRDPGIAGRIKQIVMMGGAATEGGNSTPVAEFNIYVDPEAARMVFACGAPIVMFPLDVTHQVLTTQKRMDRIMALGTPLAKASYEMLDFYRQYDQKKYGTDGGPLHDPCTVAWMIRPDLFAGRRCNVEVEVDSPLCVGQSVIDRWNVTKRPINTLYMDRVDSDGFFDLLTERLARLG